MDWTTLCHSFFCLKNKLLKYMVLPHPDFSKLLILSIDASFNSLGAVLSWLWGKSQDWFTKKYSSPTVATNPLIMNPSRGKVCYYIHNNVQKKKKKALAQKDILTTPVTSITCLVNLCIVLPSSLLFRAHQCLSFCGQRIPRWQTSTWAGNVADDLAPICFYGMRWSSTFLGEMQTSWFLQWRC